MKKKFKIPVTWEVFGEMEIEAENLEEAYDIARESPLPEDGEYISESFQIDYDYAEAKLSRKP